MIPLTRTADTRLKRCVSIKAKIRLNKILQKTNRKPNTKEDSLPRKTQDPSRELKKRYEKNIIRIAAANARTPNTMASATNSLNLFLMTPYVL